MKDIGKIFEARDKIISEVMAISFDILNGNVAAGDSVLDIENTIVDCLIDGTIGTPH